MDMSFIYLFFGSQMKLNDSFYLYNYVIFFYSAHVTISSTFYQYRSHVQSSLYEIFHQIQIKIHQERDKRIIVLVYTNEVNKEVFLMVDARLCSVRDSNDLYNNDFRLKNSVLLLLRPGLQAGRVTLVLGLP